MKEKQEHKLLEKIEGLLREVLRRLPPVPAAPTHAGLTQVNSLGGNIMTSTGVGPTPTPGTINGVPAGGSGTFAPYLLPVGSALPAGASIVWAYTADDPNVELTPSPDTTSVAADVPSTDTQGSAAAGSPAGFNITAVGTSSALPGPITTGPVFIPILPATAPAGNPPTSAGLTQTA